MKFIPLALFLLVGCISKPTIQAYIWENNAAIPAEICAREPALRQYGFYRKITAGAEAGKLEFISWCDPNAVNWQAMYKDDLDRILNGLMPLPSPAP